MEKLTKAASSSAPPTDCALQCRLSREVACMVNNNQHQSACINQRIAYSCADKHGGEDAKADCSGLRECTG